MANLANAISVQGLGDCTAEARRSRSKEFLVKKYSELSELCASVVNIPSQETRKRQKYFGALGATKGILPREGALCIPELQSEPEP